MKTYTKTELAEVLRLQLLYRNGDPAGVQANLRRAYLSGADLSGADLAYACLRGADLAYANLRGANLSGIYLGEASLYRANLHRANLHRANLRGANLSGAYLGGVNLSYAWLSGADLSGADLRGSNLSGADLGKANLSGTYLRGAIGNMREIRSMQFDTWSIAYTAVRMQIDCQNASIDEWRARTPGDVARMADGAREWWEKWKTFIITAVELAPATPTGHENNQQ